MAMFTEKGGAGGDGISGLSIIGTGMRVVGDISAEGVVKIEGTVVGTVQAAKQVLVAKGGEVEGDVVSREAGDLAGIRDLQSVQRLGWIAGLVPDAEVVIEITNELV